MNLIELHKKILEVREQVSDLYHEICYKDEAELEDLEFSVNGSLNELHMAVEIIEELIDEECA